MKKIAIFISGTGSNMESLISKSRSADLDIDFLVVSDKPDAAGIERAKALGVKVHILPEASDSWRMSSMNEKFIADLLEKESVDFILLAGFMKIVSKKIIDKFKMKIINIHPSLLPSFRGKDAQKQAFEYGVKVSGCTVHFIDEEVDTGPIILQFPADISECKSADEVKNIILNIEHEAYFAALNIILEGRWRIEGRRVILND